MSKKLTIELSDELATFAQAKVAAGEYGSMDEAGRPAFATCKNMMR